MYRFKHAFLLAVMLTLLAVRPAIAADLTRAQESLRSVANLARLAIGNPNCAPSTLDPTWTLGPPDPTWLTSGSPNQKLLALVWQYGWALRTLGSDKTTARNDLLVFIRRQSETVGGGPWGHYATPTGNEILTASHFQLWGGGMAAAYLLAIANGGVVNSSSPATTPETAVRDAARRWWADERALWALLTSVESNQFGPNETVIDAPGARFAAAAELGNNILRDDVYSLLNGLAPNKVRTCKDDRYYTVSWIMQTLNSISISVKTNLGQPPSGTATPRVRDTLCIYRLGSEFVFYFPVLSDVTEPLYWVQFRIPEGNTYGWPPAPTGTLRSFAGATLCKVQGLVAGVACCPDASQLDRGAAAQCVIPPLCGGV